MDAARNPKWLFFVNTLPIVVLFILFFGQFNVIKTLLDEDTIRLWAYFGLALLILWGLNFAYAVYLTHKKRNISVVYGIAALVCHIAFLYLYFHNLANIIPPGIPEWMMSSSIFLYAGTFLMPTLAYSVFITVVHFTADGKEHKAWVNFLISISIPLAGYLFTKTTLPLWRFERTVVFPVFIICVTVVFFFFLVRGIFIIVSKRAGVLQKYKLAWKIPVAIVLPIVGLLVNNGWSDFGMDFTDTGVVGNFNSPWFYILAVINGVFICLPNIDKKLYRIFLFIGRSITVSFTLYFFLVFLPFLPFSVIAIAFYGAGVLMLTPLALFIVHITEIHGDFQFLKTGLSIKKIAGIGILCFLTIPLCVTVSFLKDKIVLNRALTYLYAPDYSKQYKINENSLQKTLNVVKSHKFVRSLDFLMGNKIPYLSSYFNWLVLDNLTLSDDKLSYAEKVFFGGETDSAANAAGGGSGSTQVIVPDNANVEITGVSASSVFDQSQKAWKSMVDLEITNKSENSSLEYSGSFYLPEGCWISDYYLYIEDSRESGILAERKSAMWVYSNITRVRTDNRDPGILFYLTGNKVSFMVFPFSGNETRKTGIEFLHKEPVRLEIGGNTLELGNTKEAVDEIIETENFIYIPAAQKKFLNRVKRPPSFHFLVDVSQYKDAFLPDFSKRIKTALDKNKPMSANAQISFVNSYVKTFPLDDNWQVHYQRQVFKGGFFLERAIQTALFNAHRNGTRPVIVVVTDNIQNAVLDKDFSDFRFAFPDSSLFFTLNYDGTLQSHWLMGSPKENLFPNRNYVFDQTVLEFNYSDTTGISTPVSTIAFTPARLTAYLPDDNEGSLILKKEIFDIAEKDIKEKEWQSALTMQAKWMSQILHPETSGKEWRKMVKYSFASKVMTPYTSYLVVENEAQKAALRKKQDQVLSAGNILDLDEDSQNMSEPSLWILAALFGLMLLLRFSSRRKSKLNERRF